MGGKRFQFRRKHQIAAAPSVEQRLLTEAVAAERDRSMLLIPQREGEHADEALQRCGYTPLLDGNQQRFRIGVAAPVRSRWLSCFKYCLRR